MLPQDSLKLPIRSVPQPGLRPASRGAAPACPAAAELARHCPACVQVDPLTGEVAGVFRTVQPVSDDQGNKVGLSSLV